MVAALLNPRTPDRVQAAALDAAARGRDPKLPEALLAGWKGHSPAVRTRVLDTLLSRPEWTGTLLSSLEDTCVPPTEIDPSHRAALMALDNPELRSRARAVFGAAAGTRAAVVSTYRKALPATGDREAGRAVFRRVCAACHKLDGTGFDVGPDLTQLTDRSTEALLTAVLDPNRAVESKYTSFNVQLVDGRALVGLIASETAAAITLRRQEGKDDIVPRAEIEAMAGSGQSLMPEGLEKDLTPKDMADLIAYVSSGEPAPRSMEGNRPAIVAPMPEGVLRFTAATAEIRGPSLVMETQHGNLGYWQSAGDRATWRFEKARAGRYEVWLEWACPPETARQALALTTDADRLDLAVPPTRSWDDYRLARVGTLTLAGSSGRIDAFAPAPLKGPLLDLRLIELRPIEQSASCCEPVP
ncbi:MAG: c-type cytochrome [Isosphaeraceae bacterium]